MKLLSFIFDEVSNDDFHELDTQREKTNETMCSLRLTNSNLIMKRRYNRAKAMHKHTAQLIR